MAITVLCLDMLPSMREPIQMTPNPLIDWGFVTIPQATNHWLLTERADEVGDESYTFENLLPYYQRSPRYTPPAFPYLNSTNTQDPSAFSPSGGPLQVSFGNYNDPFGTWVQPGLNAIRQASIDEFQSGKLIGSAYAPSTIDPKNATRSSSESSFLQEAIERTSLQVYNNTLAEKLLFCNNTAKGVAVSSSGVSYILSARKEVIVSAGTFQSPQLLMISGIGPKAILSSLDIPVLKDLPGVGQNLWDHAVFGIDFRVKVETSSSGLDNPALAAAAIQAYQQNAAGPLSVSATGVLGWEKLPAPYRNKLSAATVQAYDSNFPADWPEIEFLPASGYLGYQRNYQTGDPMDGYNYATLATAIVSPLSRGNISINSTSMADPPLINPNWITHPADTELAIAAFKRTRQAWAAMSNLTVGQERVPGPQFQSDANILKFIRQSLAPVWHAAATCKMGRSNDTMAVVDTSMRVFGITGLRVVDASSFPFLPPGHPQATIYAVAEKVAEEILNAKGHVKPNS